MEKKHMCIVLGLFFSLFSFISCVQNEALNSAAPDLTKSNMAMPLDERALFDLIELSSFDTTKTWRDMNKIYREQIAQTDSRDLKSNAYIFMVMRKNLIEEADVQSLQYYANELEKIDFNINLNTIVALINRLTTEWGTLKTIEYSKTMYEKNITYWNEHFPGKTSYLIRNEVALNDLKALYSNN